MYSSMVATHPVVLVPLELLSEIFLFHKGSENPENWLLSLIRICHSRRRVAFSTPKLWVHLCLLIKTPRRVIPPAAAWLRRFKFLGHTRSKNGADLLNAWLRRAGPHKTTVCIGSETRRAPDGVVRGLLGVSSNIVSLALNLSSPEYFALSRLPPGLFPSLEELTLCSDGTEDWYRPVLTFADTPALRSLSLLGNHEFDPYDIQRLFSVPWQQLTCLIVRHFFSPRGVAFVLGKCRALQRCTIDDVTPGCDRTADVPPPPLVIAVFPAMQRFDARFVDADPGREDGGTTCLPGFQRLSFPALRRRVRAAFPPLHGLCRAVV
ncbi:hypothetical protein FISHEDRAFT_56280 [Fistulina hepatica ATCC 64428]|uniref:F-box domain-containing protein n=1 Tax=Fistulina hepatica ATCC 64428 TaxID=1128425 RepID=A0A0D7AJL1_9AGAR|nr:hypothetical protein FISHEDRAFT_56280 [Fistulina hepatica ATCC 64428]